MRAKEFLNETLKKVNGKWALVSKSNPKKVLQYYHGSGHPSENWIKKVEARVHSFEFTCNDPDIDDSAIQICDEFLNEVNDQMRENGELFEGTEAGNQILDFFKAHSKPAIIDNEYNIVIAAWASGPATTRVHLIQVANKCKFVCYSKGQMVFDDKILGRYRYFPENPGPLTDKTRCSILFDDKREEEHFLMLFMLKFGNLQITRQEI